MASARETLEVSENGGIRSVEEIPVHISYEIIKLFSEGLYQSPHKALEELVSNSYDAGATSVHILLPDPADDAESSLQPLWVIDDGHGMDALGFRQLWRVAESKKAEVEATGSVRAPIGQFGIGKLAAYVLAWRLTHVSKVDGVIRYAQMDFKSVTGKHQYQDIEPVAIKLLELEETEATRLLSSISARDADAWDMLFGADAAESWTVAGLSDFKNLYERLSAGTLAWVLRTGLPLHSSEIFSKVVDRSSADARLST